MLLAWLLPDANSERLSEGWTRTAYQPKHVRPSLITRFGSRFSRWCNWVLAVGNVAE